MTGDMSEPAHRESVHRALAAAHRSRIIEELDRHPDGLDVASLAQMLRVHPNTVRWHLGVLADSGFVTSHPGGRSTRGRPPIVYTLCDNPDVADIGSHGDYRLLATIAIGIASDFPDAHERALAAGEAWGRQFVNRPPPGTHQSENDTIQAVVEFLAEQGFHPEAGERQIRMHRWPLRETVDVGNSIVCTILRGLISGALAELESGLEVERFDVLIEPQLCIAQLAVRARSSSA